MTTTTIHPLASLALADDGSWYTILGAGGDLQEWVAGYEKELVEAGCGTPTQWFQTTGAAINHYAATRRGPLRPEDEFQPDLTVLLFPLDGLDVGRLAIFKIRWQDRWFDDIVDNMRPLVGEEV